MAHNFYRKAQALHEEFQKRELQYLNAEKKWNSAILKKDFNLPLQEYLQKINKREKETEEIYRNMMKQMEEIDRHTDMLSLKLEKLGVLRSSVSHMGYPFWSAGLASSDLQVLGYGATSSLSARTNFSLQEQNSKSVSTQTENISYCEKCKTELFMPNKPYQPIASENSNMSLSDLQCSISHKEQTLFNQKSFEMGNLHAAVPSLQSVFKNKQEMVLDKSHESFEISNPQFEVSHTQLYSPGVNTDSAISDASQNAPTSVMKPVLSEIPVSAYTDKSFIVDTKSNEQILSYEPNLQSVRLPPQLESISEHNLSHNLVKSNRKKSVERENTHNDSHNVSINKDEVIDTQPHFILNENAEKSETRDGEDQSIDASISKSDVESINHEFDFLESETVNVPKNTTSQNKTKVLQSSNDATTDLKETSKSLSGQNMQSDLKSKVVSSGVSNKNSTLTETHDNKSDTSGAPSPSLSVRSPNTSASDSDSLNGKETPLTATAAYQALLGNTIIPEEKKSQKYSDSESDEVENALASAVRRGSHVPPKPVPAKKDETPSFHQVESKPVNKASKPPAASKPKSKLSKNTRKVLGLDTSSGSEVELAVKPPIKKIEEDSDEFDFYD